MEPLPKTYQTTIYKPILVHFHFEFNFPQNQPVLGPILQIFSAILEKIPGYDLSLKGDDVAASGLTGYGFLVTWYAS